MALVKCPCAFRLRRLAQNDVPGGVPGYFPVNSHTTCAFRRAGSHKTDVAVLGSCIFPYTLALVTCPSAFRLPRHLFWELAQRSWQETFSGDLVQRSCQETSYRDLATELLQRSCPELLPRDLLKRSCQHSSYRDVVQDLGRKPLMEILYRDLVKRAEVFLGDPFKIAWTAILFWGPSQIFCGDLLWRDLFKNLAKRPLIEILCRDLARTPL